MSEIGKFIHRLIVWGNDLQHMIESATNRQRVRQQWPVMLGQMATAMREQADEIDSLKSAIEFDNFYEFEEVELLTSLKARQADFATIFGPDGKNIMWSPVLIKNILLSANEGVLSEAINSIKPDDWQMIMRLRR